MTYFTLLARKVPTKYLTGGGVFMDRGIIGKVRDTRIKDNGDAEIIEAFLCQISEAGMLVRPAPGLPVYFPWKCLLAS
jgi:hypothetical protein